MKHVIYYLSFKKKYINNLLKHILYHASHKLHTTREKVAILLHSEFDYHTKLTGTKLATSLHLLIHQFPKAVVVRSKSGGTVV